MLETIETSETIETAAPVEYEISADDIKALKRATTVSFHMKRDMNPGRTPDL